jgi:hypothetical protein
MERPSVLIMRHVDDSGNGYELDDLLSMKNSVRMDDIIERIITIHKRHATIVYPIGTSNPAAIEELRSLAIELQAEGR